MEKTDQVGISVVIPVYNEKETITHLHREISASLKEKFIFEIIIIDDGSTDDTVSELLKLHPVKIIRFRKNFGQTAALDAGIKAARMEYIVTMDGDGQNDPADIPALYDHIKQHRLDVVSGWRKSRKDKFIKRFTSRGANFLRQILIKDKIHDSGCSLKIYRRICFESISLYGEMHRFIPALLKIKGFRIGEMVVTHRPRAMGKTKYNWKRTIRGFIDMISVWFWNKYSVRPLHLLGGIGLMFIIFSFISAIVTFINFIQGQGMSETAWPLITVFFFLAGIQLFISGLIADILLKNYWESTRDKSYSIMETYEK